MKNILKYLIALFYSISINSVYSQTDKKLIRDGNKMFEQKKYSDAEVAYKKSLNKNQKSVEGNFNLGDAYYKQGKFDEAAKQFENLKAQKSNDKTQAAIQHNLGNTLLQSKKYEESIEAFKQSLKLYPKDDDTRYNLAYAQSMLKQQQQQQQQQNQNKDNKDQKEQKDQKQNQENQQQQKKEEQKQQQQQQQKKEISKEDAERILQALNNDEKNKHKKTKQVEAAKIDVEKDW